MRVLVTGAAGFLGSHLCLHYLGGGHEVVGVDNLVTGSRERADELAAHPGFRFLEADVSAPLSVDGPLDLILHFASPASPIHFLSHRIDTLKANSLGTLHCLDLAAEKSARFLMASTSEVYGDPLVNPQPETYWGNVNPIGPRSCYDESKRFAEALVTAYGEERGADVRIARPFNVYGPGMRADDGRAVPALICQALRGEPMTVFGDGSQTRSLCYVDDLVEAVVSLAKSDVRGPVNMGNDHEITVMKLAETIRAITASSSEIVFRALPVDDPKVRCPDSTRAREELGWAPATSNEEGLAATVAYFREVLMVPSPKST